MKDHELGYSREGKQLLATLHCLNEWEHMLEGEQFWVITKQVGNDFFTRRRFLKLMHYY